VQKTNHKINTGFRIVPILLLFPIYIYINRKSALCRRISLAKYSDIAISENGNPAFVFVLLYRDTISLVDSIILNYDVWVSRNAYEKRKSHLHLNCITFNSKDVVANSTNGIYTQICRDNMRYTFIRLFKWHFLNHQIIPLIQNLRNIIR